MSYHVITITPRLHSGSVPWIFQGSCSCGEWSKTNVWKWVALAIQAHYEESNLTNGRGLLTE